MRWWMIVGLGGIGITIIYQIYTRMPRLIPFAIFTALLGGLIWFAFTKAINQI